MPMHLVATVDRISTPEVAFELLARMLSWTAAESRLRLAPEPPAPLAALPEASALELRDALAGLGLAALAVPLPVPDDGARTLARSLDFGPTSAIFSPRAGPPLQLAYEDVSLVLRGARELRSESVRVEKQKQFSLSRAVLTQGLSMRKTTTREVRSTKLDAEPFLLVYGRSGACAAIYGAEAQFGGLGPNVQPTRLGNIQWIASFLREKAPHAIHDDRLLRLARRPLPFAVSGANGGGPNGGANGGPAGAPRAAAASPMDVYAELLRRAARRDSPST